MAEIVDGDERQGYIDRAVRIRRALHAQGADQAILQRELAIALLQRFRIAGDQSSLAEAALQLDDLRARQALEAQYEELAQQLAPLAAEVRRGLAEAGQERDAGDRVAEGPAGDS